MKEELKYQPPKYASPLMEKILFANFSTEAHHFQVLQISPNYAEEI